MNLKGKKNALMGFVGGLGVVAGLAGFVGGYYSPRTTIVLMFGIWVIGATLVNVFTD